MADNVAITAGSGTTVATDDVGGAHYQKVKLGAGVADSSAMIGHLEDAAHASGDAGILALAVRSDTAAQTAGTDGDYCALVCDSAGKLHVNVGNTVTVGSHAVTNAGTFAVQVDGAALTALQLIDNIVLAEDAAHVSGDPGVMALTVRKDTAAATAGTDGDYQPPTTDANGKLWVNAGGVTLTVGSHDVTNAGTFAVQAAQSGTWNIGTVTTVTTVSSVTAIASALPAGNNNIGDVDVASVVPGTGATNLGKAEDAAHTSGDVGVMAMSVRQDTAAALAGTDADYQPLITDASGRLHVNVGNTVTVASHAVTNAGTFAVQAACAGDVAHDSADSGNPVKIGGRAATTARTAVADADRTDIVTDAQGRIITEPYGPRDLDVIQTTTITSSTSETTVLTADATHLLDIIDCIVCNKSASASLVTFKDSTGGTTRFYLYCPAGATVGFSGQRWKQATSNNNWTATCGTSVDSVYISIRARKTK